MIIRNCRIGLGMLAIVSILGAGLTELPGGGAAQVGKPSTSHIDLSGKWTLDSGETLTLNQNGDQVSAKFTPPVPCHNSTRTDLFSAALANKAGGGIDLTSDQFQGCTREKRLITDCGLTALYTTKFKATVSQDGNTISGERFAEGWAYDEKDGKYINCHLSSAFDKWVKFTLTRECKADKSKQCAAIGHAIATIAKIIPPAANMMPSISFDPAKWQQSVTQFKAVLSANLDDLGKEFCDAATKKRIDGMRAALDAISAGGATSEAAVRTEMLKVSSIDFDLKLLAVQTCAVASPANPPPPSTGICPEGTEKKKPEDDQAIDKIRSHITDSMKEAQKMLEEYEREYNGGANTTAGQYADYWRTRLGQLKKLKGYWDNISAASCIPPEIPQLIRAMLSGRTDICINLCYATAEWIEKMYPGPQGEYQKKLFLEACGFSCPD